MMPPPIFSTPLGSLHRGDALEWLRTIPQGGARLVVADPPYNVGRASWDRLGTDDDYLEWTQRWVGMAHRALAPEGTLYLCGYPEPLARIAAIVGPIFSSYRWLVWFYRNKASFTDDWGRSHEAILHLRKAESMTFNTDAVRVPYNTHTVRYPEHPQAASSQYGGAARETRPGRPVWRPHPMGARPRDVMEIPTLCNGSAEKTLHPAQKPIELIRRLVLASSQPGDLVIDPFGGSGTTYAVCEETSRRWLGCERDASYCRLIADRLSHPDRYVARKASEPPHLRARRRERLRG